MKHRGSRAAARHHWVVVAVGIELGVGVALIATTAGDSSRPLRDILAGLFLGLLLGLSALEPVSSGRAVARHGAGRRRLARQRARRAAQRGAWARQPDIIRFASVTWPEPQLSESPTPTYPAPPGR
jgi:hypothetical protein